MNRKSLDFAALLGALLFSMGCAALQASQDTSPVEADRSQTAFFDRPVALAAARASTIPHPLIVMLTTDPWLMVIGSDSPAFALYSDGTVIFRTRYGLQSTKLDQTRKADLLRAFENPELAALAGGYDATFATDQPDNRLLVYAGKEPFYVSVYGSLGDKLVRARLPKAVTDAFDRLRNFQALGASAWLPDKIEVMVWPYEYAPDRSIVWPQRWPHLADATTRKRGDAYSIFIASTELTALKAFLASRTEKGAVEIDGKKFAASVRFPFPHESLWMAPATK